MSLGTGTAPVSVPLYGEVGTVAIVIPISLALLGVFYSMVMRGLKEGLRAAFEESIKLAIYLSIFASVALTSMGGNIIYNLLNSPFGPIIEGIAGRENLAKIASVSLDYVIMKINSYVIQITATLASAGKCLALISATPVVSVFAQEANFKLNPWTSHYMSGVSALMTLIGALNIWKYVVIYAGAIGILFYGFGVRKLSSPLLALALSGAITNAVFAVTILYTDFDFGLVEGDYVNKQHYRCTANYGDQYGKHLEFGVEDFFRRIGGALSSTPSTCDNVLAYFMCSTADDISFLVALPPLLFIIMSIMTYALRDVFV